MLGISGDTHNNLANKEVNMFDGIVGKYTSSIYHLKRGEIYNISGHKFFTMGGALN